jgi:hypothetical protein
LNWLGRGRLAVPGHGSGALVVAAILRVEGEVTAL